MRDYTKIAAWQRADELVIAVYRLTREFPPDERFGLSAQIRRAAVSAAANIAEGSQRASKRDYLRFLYMAKGSVGETSYYIHVAQKLELAGLKKLQRVRDLADEASRTLFGLIQSVEGELDDDK